MTIRTSLCPISTVSKPASSVQSIFCVKVNKCFLFLWECACYFCIHLSGMWPPALSLMRCVCACVLPKSWLTHTEMHDNDRLRPRVLRAVQSTGAEREREKNELTSSSSAQNNFKLKFIKLSHRDQNPHRADTVDWPENYICPSPPRPGWPPPSCIWGSTPETFSSSLLLRQAAFGFKLRSLKNQTHPQVKNSKEGSNKIHEVFMLHLQKSCKTLKQSFEHTKGQ